MPKKVYSEDVTESYTKSLPYPFMRNEFLDALESSQSACAETGWLPLHVLLTGKHSGVFMPLYLKNHSMGEYVFDYTWANAYHQHGVNYYPKLVTAIPFTPSTGSRIRGVAELTPDTCASLLESVWNQAEEQHASSWHLLFPDKTSVEAFTQQDLLHRVGVQYHWFNYGYQNFEDFLSCLTSRKRKMIRRERGNVAAQNIDITVEQGSSITEDIWELFYDLYERTYAKRSGTPGYLRPKFFNHISKSIPEQIAMAIARQDQVPVACALYFYDDKHLYGRYWGSIREFDYLHFELCYYTGIEFAIANDLECYDAGAQGEHKIIRGFEPIETYSLHWIRHQEFKSAIADFLRNERHYIERHIEQARNILPFKKS